MFSTSEPRYASTITSALSAGATTIPVASATNFPVVGTGATGLVTWVRIGKDTVNEESVRVTARASLNLTCDALVNDHDDDETITASDVNTSSLEQIKRDAFVMGPPVLHSGAGTATLGKDNCCTTAAATDYTLTIPDGTKDGDIACVTISSDSSTGFVTISGKLLSTSTKTRVMWWNEYAIFVWDTTAGYWKLRDCYINPMICIMYMSANQGPIAADSSHVQCNLDTVNVDNTGRMADTTNKRMTIRRAAAFYRVSGSIVSSAPVSAASQYALVWASAGAGVAMIGDEHTTSAKHQSQLHGLIPEHAVGDLIKMTLSTNVAVTITGISHVATRLHVEEVPEFRTV